MATASRQAGDRLDHPALLYADPDELLEAMVPYVTDGLDRGEVVLVAARGDNLAALRWASGPRAARVRWLDSDRWHPHPGSRLRAFHELVSNGRGSGATRFRLAGEPLWPPGQPELAREWQRYESALNAVLAPFPVSLLCLYDAARLDGSVLNSACRTHPRVRRRDGERACGEFEPPQEFLRRSNPELAQPPPWAARLPAAGDPADARRFVREQALGAGVPPERAADLCVAANEVVTNALVHGGGAATLLAWTHDGRFVCQIEDAGRGIPDPLAGYRPPAGEATGGYGLWLARQLVDLLQIGPRPTGLPGTAVRLQTARTAPR
jgi:anti-sigma regulatory factor (Ser/Thr protein kinase)